mmetsp:Transcript_7588/g.9733  ORF Transcript_7588/g.9733 Transcript_7588/m.9733 type:complete len:326 (-) Transcript_7588:272-1249(-)
MNPQSNDDASQYYSSSATCNMPLNLQQQQYSGNHMTPFHPVVYHASMPLLRNNEIDQRLSILHSNPVAPVSTALYPVMISSQPTNDNIVAYQTIGVVPSTATNLQTSPYYIQPNYQLSLPLSRESVSNTKATEVGTETYQESLNAGPVQVSYPYPQVNDVILGDTTARLSMVNSETHHNIKATDNECKTLSRYNKRCPFPQILYHMLTKAECMNFSDIISFLPHGRAFIVRDKSRFERMVMPKFFAHKSFKSFRRQVNLYGFKRLRNEECSTAYYHEAFLRGRPDLLDSIKLKKSKGVERKDSNEMGLDGDPDFYRMDVISPVPS